MGENGGKWGLGWGLFFAMLKKIRTFAYSISLYSIVLIWMDVNWHPFFFFVKISKLADISKNFEKKSFPAQKKVVYLHVKNNKIKQQ